MKLSLTICPFECLPEVPLISEYIVNPTTLNDHVANFNLLKHTFPKTPFTIPILNDITIKDERVKFMSQVCMREYPTEPTVIERDWIPTVVGTGDGGWLLFFEDDDLLNSAEYFFGIEMVLDEQKIEGLIC